MASLGTKPCAVASHRHFLQVPLEIRLRVFDHLFVNQYICVQAGDYHGSDVDVAVHVMKPVPMSAQIIRVCKQLHDETRDRLYANNIFDCSQREGMRLLRRNIGLKNFSLIKHIIIDWEQLQDFHWSLAKEEYQQATAGLTTVEMGTWRTRVLGGSSFLWAQVKSYERQLCQSAFEICQKHPNLRIVAQKAHHRSARVAYRDSQRVKWRFLVSEADMNADEVLVPIEEELALLKASTDSEMDTGSGFRMIDPF